MKACTNEKCVAFGKVIIPDNARYCPECGQSVVKYGYHYILDFLKDANISYSDSGDRYKFDITQDSFTFELLKGDSNSVLLAICVRLECDDNSLSENRLLEICNEINIECSFAKIRYIPGSSAIVSSCTFFMDDNVPTMVIGKMLEDTHEAMSMFIDKMSK